MIESTSGTSSPRQRESAGRVAGPHRHRQSSLTAGLEEGTPLEEIRKAIAHRAIPLSTAMPWPALQARLRYVLLAAPDDRPTATELAKLIEAVDG